MTTITDKLAEALRNLRALYDTDEGCRSTPEYIAATEALAAYASQRAEPSSGSNSAAPVVTPSDARVEAGAMGLAAHCQRENPTRKPLEWGGLADHERESARADARAVLQAADAVSAPSTHQADVSKSAVEIDGWRPIETAPKDGTMLLLAGFNFGNPQRGQHITAGSWRNERGWWEGLPDPVAEHLTANTQLNNLTHWMPLPAAPGSEQKGGE